MFANDLFVILPRIVDRVLVLIHSKHVACQTFGSEDGVFTEQNGSLQIYLWRFLVSVKKSHMWMRFGARSPKGLV